MKHDTIRKYVSIEQHFVSFSRRDLAKLMGEDERDLFITITAGKDAESMFTAEDVLKMALEKLNETDEEGKEIGAGIPDDAEVSITLGWRREVEIGPGQMPMHAPAPMQMAPQSALLPAPTFDPRAVGDVANCRTCGGVPDMQGPTPDCQDPAGCGRVRAQKGDLPVPKALDPQDGQQITMGAGGIIPGAGPGTQMLVNRETGQRVFAAKDGMPYGVGYDYKR